MFQLQITLPKTRVPKCGAVKEIQVGYAICHVFGRHCTTVVDVGTTVSITATGVG